MKNNDIVAYFNEGVKEGDIVEPGMIIGFVGSSLPTFTMACINSTAGLNGHMIRSLL